ncbi:hypothetical protein LJR130_001066 [Variovorax sp. LjRoot130]|uniref:hypothetical protein n=1 Tax=Variovorax sp. LjRoot130 TaxID=3342261 RepID=UPI003ED10D38
MSEGSAKGFDWMRVVGALAVIALLASLALIGALGWSDFKKFLEGPAAGWVQAFGSIGTILAGFAYIDRTTRLQNERDEHTSRELHHRQYRAVLAACLQADEAVAWTSVGAVEGPNDHESLVIATSEALAAFKSISFDQIPDSELLLKSGALRKDLVTLLIHCRAVASSPDVRSHGYLANLLPALVADLDAVKRRARDLVELR